MYQGLLPIIVYSNHGPGLTLTYFLARSNFATYDFIWKNVKVIDSLEIIAASDMEIG